MKATLAQQFKKGRRIPREKIVQLYNVDIDLGTDGFAIAGRGEEIVCRSLVRARVDFISANGINISGLEETYTNEIQMYYHQEWWCIPEAGP